MGLCYRKIAAEFAHRYRFRPRAAWREAYGWSLKEAGAAVAGSGNQAAFLSELSTEFLIDLSFYLRPRMVLDGGVIPGAPPGCLRLARIRPSTVRGTASGFGATYAVRRDLAQAGRN